MNRNIFLGVLFVGLTLFSINSAHAWPLDKDEIEKQDKIFKYWWKTDLEWKLDNLPKIGMVDEHRRPWAGHIYPDYAGGCYVPLRKYDEALHPRDYLASRYERYDQSIRYAPHWAGHCNGWTAASIRHAEPRNNVTRNGVVIKPSDIKGMLAKLYVHNAYQPLTGDDTAQINAGIFHVTLCNWIGKNKHPIGMDKALGWEIWNYPIYAYKATWAKRGENQAEVRLNFGFVDMTDREYEKAPQKYQFMYFHYQLYLDDNGKITGGHYYWDSNRIDLLWVSLKPYQGGKKGNEEGNPHLKVEDVLSLWRESVPKQYRENWRNIDPVAEDALKDQLEEKESERVLVDNEPARSHFWGLFLGDAESLLEVSDADSETRASIPNAERDSTVAAADRE
jgi:hypothetical protein